MFLQLIQAVPVMILPPPLATPSLQILHFYFRLLPHYTPVHGITHMIAGAMYGRGHLL